MKSRVYTQFRSGEETIFRGLSYMVDKLISVQYDEQTEWSLVHTSKGIIALYDLPSLRDYLKPYLTIKNKLRLVG